METHQAGFNDKSTKNNWSGLVSFTGFWVRSTTDQVGETVKTSMQEKFDSDPQFKDSHMTVTSVQVLKQGDNKFQGIAKITHEGASHDVLVEITADRNNVIWRTDPGAFMFLAQKAPVEPAPVVTKAEYDRVTKGMTLKKVQSIIGAEGEEDSRSEFEGFVTVFYQWGNSNGSSMNAMFQNDRLFTKSQMGLP